MNNGPQKFSGWSSLLSEFARLVLTVVGPKRLATSQMVDDQQNVDPVLIYGFHQTFIPAFNSTTARVERPDSILLIVHHLTWRGQTQKDGGSNPSEVEILNP